MGYGRKRARTRDQLIEAGLDAWAAKGERLTVLDVASRAGLANGTFYNYFQDRDELLDALADATVARLAEQAARDTEGAEPAWRFAVGSFRVLELVSENPTLGKVLLGLAMSGRTLSAASLVYVVDDLADGHAGGVFQMEIDEITFDLVIGFLGAAVRRIVAGEAEPQYSRRVVTRLLSLLGVPEERIAAIDSALAKNRHRDGKFNS
jgi:AcrR family transcriptional regulator